MKKRHLTLVLMAAFMLVVPVLVRAADYHRAVTVAEARELADDTKVVLEGLIIKDLGGEMYLFRDDTGDIYLEIDDRVWKKRVMDPEQLVKVYGEIDRDDGSVKVDVKKI